ncbi:hypothetical protein [Sphingobacterium sp. SYP-B4668]|uniref:hypothetical protein n=1 Tax=Sphingobacterium sp. SYP-B4668 TaxID=2996035 RepID=UPI0022DDD260|nr:hypothetical protein [Sphingobacterium sp. SYP-B4668]
MMSYKKSLIFFSLFLAAYFGEIAVNIACGPEIDPYDNQTTYFLPNIETGSYSAFQYIPYKFLYTENEPQSEAAINLDEWRDYLGKRVKKEDIQFLMYQADSLTIATLNQAIGVEHLADSVAQNTFAQTLLKKKYSNAKAYFLFTKKAEYLTFIPYNYWDPSPVNYSEILSLAEEAEEKIGTVQGDRFLKLRYAYQAARLYLYAKEYEKSMSIYEHYIAPTHSKSAVMGWAMSNYAGAKRWNGQLAEAAFLYAKVFSSNPERRVLAYKNFNYIDVPIDEVESLTTTNADRISLAAILGFSTSDMTMEYLQTCFDLDKRNEAIGMLLTREINKIEGQLITPYSLSWPNYNLYIQQEDKDRVTQHAEEVKNFALKLSGKQKGLGVLSASYISWLQGNNDEAKVLLKRIDINKLASPQSDQYQVNKMLTQLTDWQKDATVHQEGLVETLAWLSEKSKTEATGKDNPRDYYSAYFADAPYSLIGKNILSNILVPQYLAKGDTAMASLSALKADVFSNHGIVQDTLEKNFSYGTELFWKKYLSPKSILEIRDYLESPEKQQGVTKYILDGITKTDQNALTELLGTAYLRIHDYANAVKSLKQLPKTYVYQSFNDYYADQEVYAKPFITMNNDYPKDRGSQPYYKLDFAKQMLQLQEKANAEKDLDKLANIFFMMANGVYQTSTFGNSWMMVSYEWSSTDAHSKPELGWEYDYLQARQAKVWYEKARSLSKNQEFRARCTFMLAKCEQKEFVYPQEGRWAYYEIFSQSPFYQYSVHNKYFAELQKGYAQTEFYQSAMRACSYLRDFIN